MNKRLRVEPLARPPPEFDLKQTPELLALLQKTPEEHRVGPVIIMERQRKPGARLPWEERYYAEMWREIARRAGLPDTIQSMDMRTSGATEADATPDVSDRALQDAGGWRDPSTPQRYRRQKQRNAGEVVEMRQYTEHRRNVPEERRGTAGHCRCKCIKMVGDVGIEPTTS